MAVSISKPNTFDYLLMALTAIMWASAFIAMKVVVPETGPLWLATGRVIVGFLVLLPYAIYRGFALPKSPKMWALVITTSLFNVVIPFFLISWGELTVDAGIASLLMGISPFLALVGSHFSTSDDRMTLPKILAVILGFSGVLTIVGIDALSGLGRETLIAQLAIMGAAISYVVAGLLVRKIDLDPVSLVCWMLGLGAVMLFAITMGLEGWSQNDISPLALWSLIYLGVVPTGIAQIIRFILIKKIGFAVFSLSVNLVPIFGIELGALLLGEVISIRTFIALALVLAGLFVSKMEFGNAREKA